MLLHVDMIANPTGSGNGTLVPLCLYRVEDDDEPFDQRVQQLAAQMPWAHNCMLLDKISDPETRHWYIQQTVKNGWSRNVLAVQIDTRLHERQGNAVSNFKSTLPPVDSELAIQTLKDPYIFDFLGTADLHAERDIEQSLMDHIQRFLLELGAGFAFVGRQVHLEVGDQDFYMTSRPWACCSVVTRTRWSSNMPSVASRSQLVSQSGRLSS
jgi:predicted nuclease of restriction endonuclease-like (RecB) superfamily